MKTLFILLALTLTLLLPSCSEPTQSYSHDEMLTLVSVEQAAFTNDSLIVAIDSYNIVKLPIALLDTNGYYPALSNGNQIRYFIVKK